MKACDLLNIQDQVFKTEDSDTKDTFYVILTHSLVEGLDPILVQNNLYELGFVSVFEIKAGSQKGIILGYAFYTKQKEIKYQRNYLMVRRGELLTKEIFKASPKIELKYKLEDRISIITLENIVLIAIKSNYDPFIEKIIGNK